MHISAAKKRTYSLFAGLCLIAACAQASATDMTGKEIVDASSERHDMPYEYERQKMTLHDKKGNTVERKLTRFSRKGEGDLYKYLIVFNEPAGVKGVALLTWQQADADDAQWMFLPARGKKLKRIVKGAKRSYFMGTDFAFEDLSSEREGNFRYERKDDTTIDGKDVYVIEVFPDAPAVKKDTGYKFRRIYMLKDLLLPLKIEFFDRRGKPFKVQTFSDFVSISGDAYRAKHTEMENLKQKSKTTVDVVESKFDEQAVPKKVFKKRFITSRKHMSI